MRCFASARVSATATQPGRSGTYAPTLFPVSSKITRYSIRSLLSLLQPCLFQDTSKRTNRYIQAGFTGDGNGAWLRRVPKLTVTTVDAHKLPAAFFKHPDNVADLHPAEGSTATQAVHDRYNFVRVLIEYGS